MRMRILTLGVCLLSAVPAVARAEKFTIDDDTFYTLGVLAQPQFIATEDAAPDGGVGTDIFLRRARLLMTGWFDAHIGFVFVTDQANYGKNGEYNQPFFVQDALAMYKVGPELVVSAGFQLLPFLRNDFQSAGSLNTIDFRAGVIKFLPTAGRAFRDGGVVLSGHLLDSRVYYRTGVFSGVAGQAGSDTVPRVNEPDAPRLTGNVRYNILGKEDGYAFSGIYFAKEPIVNVGVGVDWQHKALGSSGIKRYLAMAADVFADVPVGEEMEVVAQGALIRYDGYAAGALRDRAFAWFAEAGFRWRMIEPTASFEYFNGHAAGTKVMTTRLGLNYWVAKHNYNVKAELTIPNLEQVEGAPAPAEPLTGTVQAQVSF